MNPGRQKDTPAALEAIAREGKEKLRQLVGELPERRRSAVLEEVSRLIGLLDRAPGDQYFRLPAEALALWRTVQARQDGAESLWGAILLATLISDLPARASACPMSAAMTREFARELQRIVAAVGRPAAGAISLDHDLFLKDLGICRLEVVPGGAALIEKHAGIPRSLAFRGGLRQLLRVGGLTLRSGGAIAPYLALHLHTPMLKSFDEAGWDRCYRLAAELLGHHPEYRGLIGSSWYYDPEVEGISPNLSYLRRIPLQGGAYFLRVGSSQADVDNATRRDLSGRRIELYREGKYLPTSYMLVWPRARLLSWAKQREEEAPCPAPTCRNA